MRSPWRREAHRLAEERGRINVDAMLRALTAKQFLELLAYKRLEPFREARADWRAAQVAAMIFNMAVAPKDRRPLKDFLLAFEEQVTKRQSPKEQFALLKVLAAAYATSMPGERVDDGEVGKDLREQVAKAHAAMKKV